MGHAKATAAITADLAATMVGPTILPAHLAVVAGHIIRRPADPIADMAAEPIVPRAATTRVPPLAEVVGLRLAAEVVGHPSAVEVVAHPSAAGDRAAVAAAEAVAADHVAVDRAAADIPVADARIDSSSIALPRERLSGQVDPPQLGHLA